MRTRIYSRLLLIALTVAATACNHKELCYEHPHTSKIRVAYDWSDAPEANPRGMCVFFYSEDDENRYYRFDFSNTTGGEIEIPAGQYKVVTYNNDTEAVRFTATNIFSAHRAYTRAGDLLEPMYGNGVTSTTQTDNGERVVITPDALWGCHATDVSVSDHGVKYTLSRAGDTDISSDQTITLYPHDMLCHYSYEVRHVENGEHISKISAAISGMAGAMNLSDESLDTEPVTLPVGSRVDAASKTVSGSFLTFGHNAANSAAHKMTFFVVMDDGSKYSVKDSPNLDVTAQVDTASNPKRVHIIIDNIKLPGPSGTGSGFNPTVDDWGVKNEDIKI